MNNIKRKHNKFFLIIGCVGLCAIFVGFSKPFFIPLSNNSFKAPVSIYIHALFSFLWVLLFTVQAYLIKTRNVRLHMKLGLTSLIIAFGIVITFIPVAKFMVPRGLAMGLGERAYAEVPSLFTTGIIFLILVLSGLYFRKRPHVHKRLLLLATIILLWPAWFRFRHFFPSVPRPDIWFGLVLADSLIIIFWIWDKFYNKKIYPVLLYVGIAIILEHTVEVLLYNTTFWNNFGKLIYLAISK